VDYWDQTIGKHERVALRARAAQAVSAGEKKCHVARRFGITRQTLHNWVAKYRSGGAEALVAKPRGRARTVRLIFEIQNPDNKFTLTSVAREVTPDR
jgi:transposase-like protein